MWKVTLSSSSNFHRKIGNMVKKDLWNQYYIKGCSLRNENRDLIYSVRSEVYLSDLKTGHFLKFDGIKIKIISICFPNILLSMHNIFRWNRWVEVVSYNQLSKSDRRIYYCHIYNSCELPKLLYDISSERRIR